MLYVCCETRSEVLFRIISFPVLFQQIALVYSKSTPLAELLIKHFVIRQHFFVPDHDLAELGLY